MSGWTLSDTSIHAGLECAYLLGRCQCLTPKQANMLGLPGATILLDGGLVPNFADLCLFTIPHQVSQEIDAFTGAKASS